MKSRRRFGPVTSKAPQEKLLLIFTRVPHGFAQMGFPSKRVALEPRRFSPQAAQNIPFTGCLDQAARSRYFETVERFTPKIFAALEAFPLVAFRVLRIFA